MRDLFKALAALVFPVLLFTSHLFAWMPQPIYAQPSEDRSPIHNDPNVYVNGTWFEGDNTTAGARYRDWHGLQWWFKEFGL